MKAIFFLTLFSLSAHLFASTDVGSCKIKFVSVTEDKNQHDKLFFERLRDRKLYEKHATEVLLEKGYELVDDSSPEYNGERVLGIRLYFSVIEQDSTPQQTLYSYSSKKERLEQEYAEFEAIVKDIWAVPETHLSLTITPYEGISPHDFMRSQIWVNVGAIKVGKTANVFQKRDLKAIEKMLNFLPDCH